MDGDVEFPGDITSKIIGNRHGSLVPFTYLARVLSYRNTGRNELRSDKGPSRKSFQKRRRYKGGVLANFNK